jgi:hypothetical protein
MKTGDVVLFSGTDLPSTVVKVATRSDYVHAAIVLSTDRSEIPDRSVVIAESHIDTSAPSLGTGNAIMGVQHQWLHDRLVQAKGPVWWVSLKVPLLDPQRRAMQVWLQEIEAQQTPYDFLQVARAGLNLWGLENTPDDAALFCSELVTRALQIAGVVDGQINPAQQVPADIVEFPCFNPPVLIQRTEIS